MPQIATYLIQSGATGDSPLLVHNAIRGYTNIKTSVSPVKAYKRPRRKSASPDTSTSSSSSSDSEDEEIAKKEIPKEKKSEIKNIEFPLFQILQQYLNYPFNNVDSQGRKCY